MSDKSVPPPPSVYMALGLMLAGIFVALAIGLRTSLDPATATAVQITLAASILVVLACAGILLSAYEDRRRVVAELTEKARDIIANSRLPMPKSEGETAHAPPANAWDREAQLRQIE